MNVLKIYFDFFGEKISRGGLRAFYYACFWSHELPLPYGQDLKLRAKRCICHFSIIQTKKLGKTHDIQRSLCLNRLRSKNETTNQSQNIHCTTQLTGIQPALENSLRKKIRDANRHPVGRPFACFGLREAPVTNRLSSASDVSIRSFSFALLSIRIGSVATTTRIHW